MRKAISVLDRITEYAIYGLIFIIPFSKAGVEIFAITAITGWLISRALCCFISRNNRKSKPYFFPKTPLNTPIFTLFTVYFISMLFSVNINLSLEGVFLKLAEYILLFFISFDIFSRKNKKLKLLFFFFITSIALLFADAAFQWITGKDFIRGFKIENLRACFSNANDFAGYLISVLPVIFCICFTRFKNIKPYKILIFKLILVGLFVFGLLSLGMAFSRGALVAYLVSMLFLLIAGIVSFKRTGKMKVFTGVILAFFSIALLAIIFIKPLGQKFTSLQLGFSASSARFYQWQEALLIIEDFPVLGTGPNTYTEVASKYVINGEEGVYPHNSYLQAAAETGILGLAAFIWVLWVFFKGSLKKLFFLSRPFYNNEIIVLGIIAGIIAALGQSFFDTNLYALRLVTLFWVMLGIGETLIFKSVDIL